jgi:lysophospholipase L1-like esterase
MRAATDAPNGSVVHFGDSFVNAGLQQNLRPRFRNAQTRYFVFGKTSAWLATWAHGPELDTLYWGYRPSLFLITLGANDLRFNQPELRIPVVQRIVQRLRHTPCVWIGPPDWHPGPSPMLDMIRENSAPCRYFDSNAIASKISRQSDKIHPDDAGGALWADAFWNWLQQERDPEHGYWALKPAPPEEHAHVDTP